MRETIRFKLNGVWKAIEVEGDETLLYLLREKFHLTGTKQGCDNGTCGSCVVVINGKAVTSCSYKAHKLDGVEILTIEGLADGKQLHPIQEAFVESGAVQCGFCIPGIIMRTYALLTANPEASEEEIVKQLHKHLCRCTGYEAILKAIKMAQRTLQ